MEDASTFIAENLLPFSPNPELYLLSGFDHGANRVLLSLPVCNWQPAPGPSAGRPITMCQCHWQCHARAGGASTVTVSESRRSRCP